MKKTTQMIQNLDISKEDIEEIAEKVPWIEYIASGYKLVRQKRFIFFLHKLENLLIKKPEDTEGKLKQYIKSKFAQDFLCDYIDKVLLNSSDTVKSALAILYCEQHNNAISEELAYQIILAIHGMSEREVMVLLGFYISMKDAMEHNSTLTKTEGPFKIFLATDGFIKRIIQELKSLKLSETEIYSYYQDFKNRRIFLEDPATRYGATIAVGVHILTHEVYDLLNKAQKLSLGNFKKITLDDWSKERIMII
ncbi:MAG: hypothetical protein WCV50_01795 [Patescibacteria group bacterium]|jgi:hypothetical protein